MYGVLSINKYKNSLSVLWHCQILKASDVSSLPIILRANDIMKMAYRVPCDPDLARQPRFPNALLLSTHQASFSPLNVPQSFLPQGICVCCSFCLEFSSSPPLYLNDPSHTSHFIWVFVSSQLTFLYPPRLCQPPTSSALTTLYFSFF